jgi:thiaminase
MLEEDSDDEDNAISEPTQPQKPRQKELALAPWAKARAVARAVARADDKARADANTTYSKWAAAYSSDEE